MAELGVKKYLVEGLPYLNERADRDIEKYRKSDFILTLKDKSGNPLKDIEIHAVHKVHDFDFGCNIFMFDQYETKAENVRYLEKLKKVFNTVVLPLYWEGTEPKHGYLRYDVDSDNDIYRRPPVMKAAQYCKKNGIRLKGHPLFWHEFIPNWLPENFEELKPLIEKRFEEISSRFAADVPVFDCVNEPTRVWNVHHEHLNDDWKHVVPPDDYCKWIFDTASKHFPNNELVLNETVGASFSEFHGTYSAFYLNIKDLLSRGAKIDRIGLQCHTCDNPAFRNVYDASRMYEVLDTYAHFGKQLVLSEISVPSVFNGEIDEEFQTQAAQMLYKICFSHPMMSGIFWWNLTDDGVATTKRKALGENLPSTGLIDGDYNEKPAFKAIDNLINKQWRTDIILTTDDLGKIAFRGFDGEYEITVNGKAQRVHLNRNDNKKAVEY